VISATLDVAGGFVIMLNLAHEMDSVPTSFPKMGTIDLRVDDLRPGRGLRHRLMCTIVHICARPRLGFRDQLVR